MGATIRKYQNRTIEAAQVIAELIELAKQMREGQKRTARDDALVQFFSGLLETDAIVLHGACRSSCHSQRRSATF